MAQRDYEEHLGAPAGDQDGLDAGYSPPDRLQLAGGGAALETPDSMDGADVGIDGGAAGPEEAAVHITDDPGAPVETEPSVAASPELDDPELEAALDDAQTEAGADDAEAQAARDVRADGDVFDPGLPGTPATEQADELGAERIDRQPESGGAAGVDGRRDAGPDVWR